MPQRGEALAATSRMRLFLVIALVGCSSSLGVLAAYTPARAGSQLSRLYDVGAQNDNVGNLDGDGCN